MLEKDIEIPVTRYAEGKGCIAIKLNGEHNRGKPDKAFFYGNTVLIIEFKKPGEKPTKLQQQWLDKFVALGFEAIVIDNVGKGKTAVDKFKKRADDTIKTLGAVDKFLGLHLYDDL